MTFAFESWNRGKQPGAPYTSASPNLTVLAQHLTERWHLKNLGCYDLRPIRGGTAWSTHAFGAAVDMGWAARHGGPGIETLESEILPWLIANAEPLGIQRIHHYARNRYWQTGAGWVLKSPGHGVDWLHIETHPTRWADSRPVLERLNQPNTPTSAPRYPGKPVKQGSTGKTVQTIQTRLGTTPDGKFGPITAKLVRDYQTANSLHPDGIVGPITWAALFPNA